LAAWTCVPRYPDADGLHLTAAEWQEFAEAMKSGKFDKFGGLAQP
jgi:hypothetical protein